MKTKKGLFITFEGPEASGKSSQILLLKKYLIKKNTFIDYKRARRYKISRKSLRKIILSNKSKINNIEEILLLNGG